MTHQSHRFAIATCKRPNPSVKAMSTTIQVVAGADLQHQRQRRRRSDHG